jgi:hypothetical protein
MEILRFAQDDGFSVLHLHSETTARDAPSMQHQHITEEMRACIEECSTCHDICLETMQHCLHMGGKHAEPHHIRLMQDCVEICQTSANFMLRGSDLHKHTCRACAEVCARCAADCAKMADDERMKTCADTCRSCAESCRRMSA